MFYHVKKWMYTVRVDQPEWLATSLMEDVAETKETAGESRRVQADTVDEIDGEIAGTAHGRKQPTVGAAKPSSGRRHGSSIALRRAA
jgi:hypothetical protein